MCQARTSSRRWGSDCPATGSDFIDSEGRLAAFDPTVQQSGPPGLLLREDLLADYLESIGVGARLERRR